MKQLTRAIGSTAILCLLTWMILQPRGEAFAAAQNDQPPTLALENVTVIPMAGPRYIRNATVIIRDGRIAAIEPARTAEVTADMHRIDARGKWLMPGLTDMHVHIENIRMLRLLLRDADIPASAVSNDDVFLPYIANGVLQVLDLQGMSETIGQRVEIEAGRVLGPRIFVAAMIDGSPPLWPVGMTRVVTAPEDGRQAVRDAAAEGYDAIKVYSRLSFEALNAIADEAQKLKLPVIGHLPGRQSGRIAEAFPPGLGMVAHAEEFALHTNEPSFGSIPQYVELMKKHGAWLTATLSLDERLLEQTRQPDTLKTRPELVALHPMWRKVVLEHNPYIAQASPERIAALQKIVDFNRDLVRAFVAAGVPVVAGTDAPVPGIVPGFAIHDELGALVRAGMTHYQALEAATRLPCEWLGVLSDRGTVELGKQADLLLLDGDPLADVGNTRRISAVIVGGRYLRREALDERMRALMEKK
jgi:imidazolonepropionase-like amidohydrolase